MVRTTDRQATTPQRPQIRARPENDIRDWIKTWNEDSKPFIWTKTADEIGERLASYLQNSRRDTSQRITFARGVPAG